MNYRFFLASLIAFGFAYYSYFERKFLGFPDGFLTNTDRWRKIFLTGATIWHIFWGLRFINLALYPSPGSNYSFVVYLTTIVFFITLEIYFRYNSLQTIGTI
jgi:hypothetical protein